MPTKLTKPDDFIELEFEAKTEDGAVFDTTEKLGSVKLIIGQGMVVKGLDEQLLNREVDKSYEVTIEPSKAFGLRQPELIRVVPLSAFEQMPQKGQLVLVDGAAARVAAIGAGRVLLDFNHPLAGKKLIYRFKIKRIIEDEKEKAMLLGQLLGLKIVEQEGQLKIDGQASQEQIAKFKQLAQRFKLNSYFLQSESK